MAITLLEDIVNRFIVNSPADHTVEEYSGNTNVSAINSVLVYSRKENVKVFARVTATQVWQTLGVVGNDLDAVSGHGTEYRKDAVFNVTTMDRVSIISLGAETTARIVFNPSLPTEGLENAGGLTSMGGTMTSHILPDTDNVYDIGSAEKKIRHLFLSDNSLWIGDTHKVTISGGKMKFRKRKTSSIPPAIVEMNAAIAEPNEKYGSDADILAGLIALLNAPPYSLNIPSNATWFNITMYYWEIFAKHQKGSTNPDPGIGQANGGLGQPGIVPSDIFRSNPEDYEDDFEAGASSGGSTATQTIVSDMAQNQITTLTVASGTTPIVQIYEDVLPVDGSDVLSYTGADQSFVVPAGVTSLTAKLWGAGAGAGDDSNGNPPQAPGGGHAVGDISVTPGETLTLVVGQGGGYTSAGNAYTPTTYGFGGRGRVINHTGAGGGGGGLAGIFRGSVDQSNALLIAPGAGGIWGYKATPNVAGTGNVLGFAGGLEAVAPHGGESHASNNPGGPGTQAQGGKAGTWSGTPDGTAGSALQGGTGGHIGGGGGAGYFGGGGGAHVASGGGGSAFLGTATNASTIASTDVSPPNASDADYVAGVGVGGDQGVAIGSNSAGYGGNALIVLSYSTGGTTKTFNKTNDYEIEHASDTTVEVKKTSAGSADVKIRLI